MGVAELPHIVCGNSLQWNEKPRRPGLDIV